MGGREGWHSVVLLGGVAAGVWLGGVGVGGVGE